MSSSTCCHVDPDSIPASTRDSWCNANIATCTAVCMSQADKNECDSTTLDFTCRCAGADINLARLANTVPSLMCKQWQSNCIADHPGDSSAQQQCRETQCGSDLPGLGTAASSTGTGGTFNSLPLSDLVSSPSPSASATRESSVTRTGTADSATERTRTNTATGKTGTGTATGTAGVFNTASTASGGNRGSNSSGTGKTPSKDGGSNGGLGTGAKAGIAVGVILGILIIVLVVFLMRKRSKRKTLSATESREPYKPSDEKQVVVPVASEISQKPELHNGSIIGYTPELDSEPVPGYNSSYSHPYPSPGQRQDQHQSPAELYSSNEQADRLHASVNANPLELHSSPRNQNVDPVAAFYASTSTTQDSPYAEAASVPAQPRPSELTFTTGQALSKEEIERLEEEERRIDAEMAEAQRMKELREQKFAIQQKLRDAQRR